MSFNNEFKYIYMCLLVTLCIYLLHASHIKVYSNIHTVLHGPFYQLFILRANRLYIYVLECYHLVVLLCCMFYVHLFLQSKP